MKEKIRGKGESYHPKFSFLPLLKMYKPITQPMEQMELPDTNPLISVNIRVSNVLGIIDIVILMGLEAMTSKS